MLNPNLVSDLLSDHSSDTNFKTVIKIRLAGQAKTFYIWLSVINDGVYSRRIIGHVSVLKSSTLNLTLAGELQ